MYETWLVEQRGTPRVLEEIEDKVLEEIENCGPARSVSPRESCARSVDANRRCLRAMSNQTGQLFRVTTFGESHGPAMGLVIDGCPWFKARHRAFTQSLTAAGLANPHLQLRGKRPTVSR